jgi:hypothetical protein
MSVKFPGTGTVYIKWTTPTNAVGLVSKTISLRVYPTSFAAAYDLAMIFDGTGTDSDEYNDLAMVITTGRFGFIAHFSTTNGIWLSTSAAMTLNAWNHILITYDGSNVANNPIFYLNGVSVAVTRSTAPVGTYRTGTNTDIYIGSPTSGSNPVAKIEDLRIYTGIKTAAQVAVIAGEDIKTNATIDESNLVFHAPLVMCKGLTYPTFAGSVLGAGNTFFDRINGYLGVPSGSPVGE